MSSASKPPSEIDDFTGCPGCNKPNGLPCGNRILWVIIHTKCPYQRSFPFILRSNKYSFMIVRLRRETYSQQAGYLVWDVASAMLDVSSRINCIQQLCKLSTTVIPSAQPPTFHTGLFCP